MKIAEVIKQMEKATEHMSGRKGVVVREIHGEVMGAIRPVATSAGLEVRTWDVTVPDDYGRHNTIIRYDTDLTEDKRYKHDRIGKLNRMTFEPGQDYISPDDTVEEAIVKVKYNNATANLERLQNELNNLLLEVDKYKEYISSVSDELTVLRAQLNK